MPTITAIAPDPEPEPEPEPTLIEYLQLQALDKCVKAARHGQPRREAFWRGFFSGLNGPRSN